MVLLFFSVTPEKNMKLNLLYASCIFVLTNSMLLGIDNSGLILPMPGQIIEQPKNNNQRNYNSQQKPKTQTNTQTSTTTSQQTPQINTNQRPVRRNPNVVKPLDPNRVFIPLPPSGQRSKPQIPNNQPTHPTPPKMQNDPQSLIQLPANVADNEPNDDFDSIKIQNEENGLQPRTDYQNLEQGDIPAPSKVAEQGNQSSETVEPPIITTETPQVVDTDDSGSITVFPKDTSSAIFMVMKSWQCEDYDASTLLEHAVGIYSQEAEDPFKIEGLPSEADSYTVSIEEEDITLDELLDIIAQKAGRDWGVDMNNKIIYFYPAGVTEKANDNW